MFTVTRYCVQVFGRRGGAAETQLFRGLGEAMASGRLAQRRAKAVAVYEVTGEPVQDLWQEPRLIASFGDERALRRAA